MTNRRSVGRSDRHKTCGPRGDAPAREPWGRFWIRVRRRAFRAAFADAIMRGDNRAARRYAEDLYAIEDAEARLNRVCRLIVACVPEGGAR